MFDLISDLEETLDFKERVINMSLAYNNLIVTSQNQCYIYNITVIFYNENKTKELEYSTHF